MKALQSFGSDVSIRRIGDSVDEILTALMAEVSGLIVMDSTNRRELVYSKLVAPIAKMAFRSPINRDGPAKCIVRHMFPSLLRRERSLMCFSFFIQHNEFIMLLSVALVILVKFQSGLITET
jgi:hypothetical protein